MIRYITGDILNSNEDIIVQQVNCQNVMGSGLAKALYTKWPVVKTEYHKYCDKFTTPYDLMGKVQYVSIGDGRYVANVFAQLNYGRCRHICYTSYSHFETCLRSIADRCRSKTIAIPHGIGCGLANGKWEIVSDLIHLYLENLDVVIYKKQ